MDDAKPMTEEEYQKFVASFRQQMETEINHLYESMALQMYAMPADWKPQPLTRRQKLNLYVWRVRSWVARPFVWVLRLLDPYVLRSDDD
jgi:hypothetical protein